MKIIFSHGRLGNPHSAKMTKLMLIAQRLGFETVSLDYTFTKNPELRLQRFIDFCKEDTYGSDYLLVGSSMGGYVSMVGAETLEPRGCFLLCPALYMKGYEVVTYHPPKNMYIEIVHGWKDMTVLPEMSQRFAREHSSTLHLIDTDHSMMDSLVYIGLLFEAFLKRFLKDALPG